MKRVGLMFLLAIIAASPVSADIVISEWMYNGLGAGSAGEYVELTNTGPTAVSLDNWTFDDDSQTPGTVNLSAFGTVQPGQSVIITDESAAVFAANWGLSGIAIIGGNSANLGRNDEINIYDDGNVLVDRLTYGDQNFPGTIRTQNRSGNIPASDYGFTTVQLGWTLATAGDSFGSYASTRGEIGSPGVVPEPTALAMLALGAAMTMRRRISKSA